MATTYPQNGILMSATGGIPLRQALVTTLSVTRILRDGELIYVSGYSGAEDGGGGFFYGAVGGSQTVVTGIVGTAPNGRWIRVLADARTVNVKWFGATGNGVTDDRAAFQAAFDYLGSAGGTIEVPAPAVRYYCATGLVVPAANQGRFHLKGVGQTVCNVATPFGHADWLVSSGVSNPGIRGSVIQFGAGAARAFDKSSISYAYLHLEDLVIIGPGTGTTYGLYGYTGFVITQERCTVANFWCALLMLAVSVPAWIAPKIRGCVYGFCNVDPDGVAIGDGGNNYTVLGLVVEACTYGHYLKGKGLNFIGGLVQSCNWAWKFHTDARGLWFHGVYGENNVQLWDFPLVGCADVHFIGLQSAGSMVGSAAERWRSNGGSITKSACGHDVIIDGVAGVDITGTDFTTLEYENGGQSLGQQASSGGGSVTHSPLSGYVLIDPSLGSVQRIPTSGNIDIEIDATQTCDVQELWICLENGGGHSVGNLYGIGHPGINNAGNTAGKHMVIHIKRIGGAWWTSSNATLSWW